MEFHRKHGFESYLQIIIPNDCRDMILFQMHKSITSEHHGEKKTHEKLLQHFYWYSLRYDVRQWIRTCFDCQANKKLSKLPRATLGIMLVRAAVDCCRLIILAHFLSHLGVIDTF